MILKVLVPPAQGSLGPPAPNAKPVTLDASTKIDIADALLAFGSVHKYYYAVYGDNWEIVGTYDHVGNEIALDGIKRPFVTNLNEIAVAVCRDGRTIRKFQSGGEPVSKFLRGVADNNGVLAVSK